VGVGVCCHLTVWYDTLNMASLKRLGMCIQVRVCRALSPSLFISS